MFFIPDANLTSKLKIIYSKLWLGSFVIEAWFWNRFSIFVANRFLETKIVRTYSGYLNYRLQCSITSAHVSVRMFTLLLSMPTSFTVNFTSCQYHQLAVKIVHNFIKELLHVGCHLSVFFVDICVWIHNLDKESSGNVS